MHDSLARSLVAQQEQVAFLGLLDTMPWQLPLEQETETPDEGDPVVAYIERLQAEQLLPQAF